MADCQAPVAPRLYSQIEHDERGNFEYQGDLQQPGLSLAALASSVRSHLEASVAGASFSVSGESFAGGRKLIVETLDAPADLSDPEARRTFELMLRDQVERFGFTRSNILQDFMSCSFYSEVRIGRAYWYALARRKGMTNIVEPLVPLAAFKRRIQPGDQLKLVAAPSGHRALGSTRKVIAVRSADLILEGPSYLKFPRAAAFACDGRQVRIGVGHDREPDAHLLYEWLRAA
ncbi:hypothetical protein DMC47_38935 [Nostoc sp. 3335mG]|nr:hypothetical protein DMC47_38935 [Nostoc sp. 3335mG]